MNKQLLKKWVLSVITIVFMIETIIATEIYAKNSYTITIKATDNVSHTYEAYQIFSGDLYENEEDEENNKTLSNIEWGSEITNENNLLAALKKDNTIKDDFNTCTTSREVAVVLEGFENDDTKLKAFAEVVSKFLEKSQAKKSSLNGENYQITVEEPGYYFIKDEDDSLSSTQYSAYTRYILEVAGNVTVEPKSEKPTVEKSLSEDTNDIVGDYAIYQEFMYCLTANLPASEEYGEYETYKLIFEDEIGQGITYVEKDGNIVENVIVKAKDKTGATKADITLKKGTDYTEEKASGDKKLTITVTDLVKILNEQEADITKGVKVIVEYKAYLNEQAYISKDKEENKPNLNTVKLQYSNDPNAGKDSTGTTMADKTYVFTYGIDNTKYEKYANKKETEGTLAGAKFRLYKAPEKTDENEIKLIWDAGLLAYRPIKSNEIATEIESREEADIKGKFNIVGLDAGTYILVEVETPEGYNTCEDLEIKIEPSFANVDNSQTVTFENSSNMNNDIINVHGSKLPSTGSITLIIICGVAIILGISGLILSKNKKEE